MCVCVLWQPQRPCRPADSTPLVWFKGFVICARLPPAAQHTAHDTEACAHTTGELAAGTGCVAGRQDHAAAVRAAHQRQHAARRVYETNQVVRCTNERAASRVRGHHAPAPGAQDPHGVKGVLMRTTHRSRTVMIAEVGSLSFAHSGVTCLAGSCVRCQQAACNEANTGREPCVSSLWLPSCAAVSQNTVLRARRSTARSEACCREHMGRTT
jgi:hypothetical protein